MFYTFQQYRDQHAEEFQFPDLPQFLLIEADNYGHALLIFERMGGSFDEVEIDCNVGDECNIDTHCEQLWEIQNTNGSLTPEIDGYQLQFYLDRHYKVTYQIVPLEKLIFER